MGGHTLKGEIRGLFLLLSLFSSSFEIDRLSPLDAPSTCTVLPQAQGNRVKWLWIETSKTMSQINLFVRSLQVGCHSDSKLVKIRANECSLNEYMRWISFSQCLSQVSGNGRLGMML